MARQKEKFSAPQVTHPVSQNLPAQVCTKADRPLISDMDSSPNAISNEEKSSSPNNSFSIFFYALRDIKAGEQLFYSYCSIEGTLAQRQAELAPYGFVCKCTACINATPETNNLRSTSRIRIAHLLKTVLENSKIEEGTLEEALRLEKDMVGEGLDIDVLFIKLLESGVLQT